jgi:hypothetical protein
MHVLCTKPWSAVVFSATIHHMSWVPTIYCVPRRKTRYATKFLLFHFGSNITRLMELKNRDACNFQLTVKWTHLYNNLRNIVCLPNKRDWINTPTIYSGKCKKHAVPSVFHLHVLHFHNLTSCSLRNFFFYTKFNTDIFQLIAVWKKNNTKLIFWYKCKTYFLWFL